MLQRNLIFHHDGFAASDAATADEVHALGIFTVHIAVSYTHLMFGKLNNYKDEEFYKENPYFYIYTPDYTYRYDIFSCYLARVDNEVDFYTPVSYTHLPIP